MADQAQKVSRPMKFPYTFSAKIAQFPFRHHMKHDWIWRYYPLAVLLCIPIFAKISKLCRYFSYVIDYVITYFICLANSPENVAKWAEIRRKEAEGHH